MISLLENGLVNVIHVVRNSMLLPKKNIQRIGYITLEIYAAVGINMCNCRVCDLESRYPDQIDRVVEKVFEFLMEDISF
jgi:hypothetical protein